MSNNLMNIVTPVLLTGCIVASVPARATADDETMRYYDYDDPYSDFFENYYNYDIPPIDPYDARNDGFDPYLGNTYPVPTARYPRGSVYPRYEVIDGVLGDSTPGTDPYTRRYGTYASRYGNLDSLYGGDLYDWGDLGQGGDWYDANDINYPAWFDPRADAGDEDFRDDYLEEYYDAYGDDFSDYFEHHTDRLYDVDYSEFGYDYGYDADGYEDDDWYYDFYGSTR